MAKQPQLPPLVFELCRDFSTAFHSTEAKKTYAFSAKVNLRNLGPSFSNGPVTPFPFSVNLFTKLFWGSIPNEDEIL